MSNRNTDRPSVRSATSASGVVRASSTIRSECSAREVQIFCPLTTQPSPRRSARVLIWVVSEPASGSVTANACRRSSPEAIEGSQRRFCSGEPWRNSVPIVYIWAWHAPALAPDAQISSRIALAVATVRPEPPYSSGISAASPPCAVSAATNSLGYPSGSSARQYSPGNSAQSARTASRIGATSSGSVKSTSAELPFELVGDLEQVGDSAIVGDVEDPRAGVGVDGDDRLRPRHPAEVLRRAGDAEREIDARRDRSARLADLARPRRQTRLDQRPRHGERRPERVGEPLPSR